MIETPKPVPDVSDCYTLTGIREWNLYSKSLQKHGNRRAVAFSPQGGGVKRGARERFCSGKAKPAHQEIVPSLAEGLG
jgi:hypothetical protein